MKCTQCGKEFEGEGLYCEECSEENAVVSENEFGETQGNTMDDVEKSGKKIKIISIICGVLLLLACFFCF